jgi:hypothetical protein
MYINIDKK